MITRPALRYHGSKWRLAPWIIGQFPAHVCYVEPFGGGMSVLLRKEPSSREVYNDLDGDVVNFFRVLREQDHELVRMINLTPVSRAELLLGHEPTDDPLERARRLYVRAWQSRGGPVTPYHTGWRFERTDNRGTSVIDDWLNNSHLGDIAERLRHVQLENDDALDVVSRFDGSETLFYVDPPYLTSTLAEGGGSKHPYRLELNDEQHEALAARMNSLRGMAILSGYESALYERLYPDWTMVRRASFTQSTAKIFECLWLSPAVMAKNKQLDLFG